MKTNGTLNPFLRLAWIILLTLFFFFSQAQPDYDFRNKVLVSGTANQIGALYRFNNVKAGVDAFVTITDIGAGITVVDLDAGSGYPEALQPTLDVQPKSKGYLEMKIEFLYAGTNDPYVQAEIPLTCIDVDGEINDSLNNPVNEFDEINLGPGAYVNYDMLGGEMIVTQNGDWFVGKNTATIDYPGRDTLAKQVMFTVVNANIADCIVRVGVDNQSLMIDNRLRSVYFKKFMYANPLLPLFGLTSFNGVRQENKTMLAWELASNCSFTGITIERSMDGRNYTAIGEAAVVYSGTATKQHFADYFATDGNLYYRLKITQPGSKYNYSNVLLLKGKSTSSKGFRIYPTIVGSNANINLDVQKNQKALLQISDYSGRIVKQQSLNLQQGNNTLQLNNMDQLPSGNYIAVIRFAEAVHNQRFTIR